jgi:hypothetical protein
MKLGEFRPAFQAWVESKLTIDSWYLEIPPEVGQSVAMIEPYSDLESWRFGDQLEIKAKAIWQLRIATRYAAADLYSEYQLEVDRLNLARVEQIHATMTRSLWNAGPDIHPDIIDCQPQTVPKPVTVGELERDETGDWLIVYLWRPMIGWVITPDEDDPLVDITELTINLYRASLTDLEDNILDRTFIVEAP